MSSSFLCQGKYKAVAAVHYLSRFFSQRQESCVETHPTKRRIHRDILKFRTLHFGERGSGSLKNLFVNFMVIKMNKVLIKFDSRCFKRKINRTYLYYHLVNQIENILYNASKLCC